MFVKRPKSVQRTGREALGLALASLAALALLTGCQSEDVADHAPEPPDSAVTAEKSEATPETEGKPVPATVPAESSPQEAGAPTIPTAADQLAFSRQLEQAEKASGPYQVIGQHTKNFMDLYNFFEAAGWNQAIDSMTMQSCPEGYEVFCEARGAFVKLFQDAGGDVEGLTELMQQTDFRAYLYQLAAAADMYQRQYPQLPPQAGAAPSDVNSAATWERR